MACIFYNLFSFPLLSQCFMMICYGINLFSVIVWDTQRAFSFCTFMFWVWNFLNYFSSPIFFFLPFLLCLYHLLYLSIDLLSSLRLHLFVFLSYSLSFSTLSPNPSTKFSIAVDVFYKNSFLFTEVSFFQQSFFIWWL